MVEGAGTVFCGSAWRMRRQNLASEAAGLTPVMRQYFAAKEQYPDCLMFCRIGDFYELFYEDAILVSRELQLTLTARDREKKQPMCGVPYHAAEVYLQRLLRKGYRIALCEQMEDPKLTKTIVRREVTRVLTPGTAVDPALGAEQSNCLASVCVLGAGRRRFVGWRCWICRRGSFGRRSLRGRLRGRRWWMSWGGCGRWRCCMRRRGWQWRLGEAVDILAQGEERSTGDRLAGLDGIRTKTAVEEWVFTAEYAVPLLRNHFKVHSLDGMGLGGHEAAAVAAGALLHYMQKTKQGGLEHVDGMRFYERSIVWSWMR